MDEVESFIREGYVTQFKEMEKRFKIKRSSFKQWPDFVECAQRRNIITHCNGEVSNQYIKVCKEEGVQFTKDLEVGSSLGIGREYLSIACDTLTATAFNLGQILWRMQFPDEHEEYEGHITEELYNALNFKDWSRAKMIGEFAHIQKKVSNEKVRCLHTINYAIATLFDGDKSGAEKLLEGIDWSASKDDFLLATHVIKGDYSNAIEIMHRIGKEGEYINQEAYHTFPLFLDFSQEIVFLEAYEEIYGEKFVNEVYRAVEAELDDVHAE